ncbi:hypothetical protein DICPUDRAFT_79372 [Dictyostelium purpureum]|uniref:Calcium load-activated calcium channel n=1 Tax=Dictyostelium purpureum TaxID=5786 RepID=F0ZMD9_DICPU|nr:uncharacterized protein DICPUDRAFT_79372 [Dictyostelium purpureum]EGC34883.1 hypothetical protein DICPUDRAFT_79372 [Dictyostelium purpureum]|eukprot:XP_003288575.1 hypothetical protein DICPUDRAFT_79372 [Dictyostelium purpureum]
MVQDIIFILFLSVASTLLSEGVSWLLVYRTDSYKKSKANIDRLQAQLDKIKEQDSNTSTLLKKKQDKKGEKIEEALKIANKDLSLSKFKSMFFVAISMIGLFSYLNRIFDGVVVCKLPFVPIGFLQNISHRTIAGDDYTDCSMTFIYAMCSMFVRNNIQMILGTAPPKSKNPFLGGMDEKK